MKIGKNREKQNVGVSGDKFFERADHLHLLT